MQSNSVAAQLKKSILLINVTIVIFLFLYILQAYQLYRRAGQSELWVNRTNDVLQQIKSTQTGVRDIEVALQGFLLTGADEYKTALTESADNTIKRVSYLRDITKEHGQQYLRAVTLRSLIVQKKSTALLLIKEISEGKIKPTDARIKTLMNAGNQEMDELLSLMESTQSQVLASRTSENKSYSRSRITFSVASFCIISTFLILALYKVQQSINKKSLAEETARKQEAKYRALVENAGVTTLIVDQEGIVKFVSRNIKELCGYTIEDLLQKPFHDKIVREYRSHLHHAIFDESPRGNTNTSAEIQVITLSGTKKWVSCRIFPANREGDYKEWQVVLWDIEEEKQKALEFEALEAAHNARLKMVQDIIDNVPSVLYIKDRKSVYLMVNRKTEEVFNAPASDILGKSTEQFHKNAAERLSIYRHTDDEVVNKGKIVELEEMVKGGDKDRYYWITKFPLLDEAGNVKFIGVIASDITERKETELKLIESRQEAEQAKAAQEAFLANMSHEIRTPMNGIIGMANLLISTDLNDEQKDFTESIQESAGNLLAIINDLLDFSKIKSGKFEFERISFRPRDTIRKAIYPLQFRAEEKMIKLNLSIDGNVPEVLSGDPLRLQQVIINLAGNAIKFTSNGSVEISVSSEKLSSKKISLNVFVKDSGIGIPADNINKIFESFSQSSTEDARKYGGTGLGLAIVKQLVELQQGHVRVTSTVGKGSIFSFSIPYDVGEAVSEELELLSAQTSTNFSLGNIRVLVAEDNLINQKVVKNTLSKQGAQVMIANNGQEAIQLVKQGSFDVILMDIQMPEVDGYKATRYIRQVMKSDIPIIAMTADALKGEEDKCIVAGMNGYISKPFEPRDLYNLIASFTGHRDQVVSPNVLLDANDGIVDFSFLQEIADNDSAYMHEVLDIFISTMPVGLAQLSSLINDTEDFESIAKQAHFLKSSVGIVKIRGMFDQLAKIELMAKQGQGLNEIRNIIKEITDTYNQAHPLVLKEKEKHNSAQI
ncbi:MAG TPA: ATP-binding protein [Flavipsychrobacter sp.]|nr:ATP-binding protein [Flavipsychrobacter sp.]